jgi:hypothetical protein
VKDSPGTLCDDAFFAVGARGTAGFVKRVPTGVLGGRYDYRECLTHSTNPGGLALLGTTVLSALGGDAGAFGLGVKVVLVVASVAVNAGVFILAFRISTARNLTVRQVALGAVAAAVGWQVLQSFGAVYIGHVVKIASATNAVFALVLGMLAFLYFAATLVCCARRSTWCASSGCARGRCSPRSPTMST